MDWKKEAIEKLRRLNPMRQSLQSIPQEIRRLEQEAQAIPSSPTDRIVVKSGPNTQQDRLLGNLMRREELAWSLEQAKQWVATTEQALKVLDTEERHILNDLYILGRKNNIQQLCDKLCIEQSSIYRKRDRALRKFTLALYGRLKS